MKGDDGDLPMLELDYMNAPIAPRTGMSFGASGRLWYGWENEVEAEPERAEKVIQDNAHSNEGRRLWETIVRHIDSQPFALLKPDTRSFELALMVHGMCGSRSQRGAVRGRKNKSSN